MSEADGILKTMILLISSKLGNAATEGFAVDIIERIAKAREIGKDGLFGLMAHVHLHVLPLSSNDEVSDIVLTLRRLKHGLHG